MNLSFEWDEAKAAANQRKHRITFEEATTVFGDPMAAIFDDEEHSQDEVRELIIGQSEKNRLLLVSFTERHPNIRIISARRATKRERENHEKNRSR